jgi:hypothetical protein
MKRFENKVAFITGAGGDITDEACAKPSTFARTKKSTFARVPTKKQMIVNYQLWYH